VNDDPLHSPDWYRVEALHLTLRPDVCIARQVLRGEPWFVYRNQVSGRQLRLNFAAHRFAGQLDGRRTVGEIWESLLDRLGDAAPSQQELVTVVQQLAEMAMVTADLGVDLDRLADREKRRERSRLMAAANPLLLRLRLFDPTRLLDATARAVAPLYSVWALPIYLLIILMALTVAGQRWSEITAWGERWMATPGFGLTLWLVYPGVKAVHELAHAWAVRTWGGRVNEVGISLMLLTPVPYVDASAAALFESRGRRVAVSLAGILAEGLMAAGALWLWLSVDDGMLRTAAFAVMFIGGVSTLLVNGNPLMRFDAYHALADALGLPNLADRARQLHVYLARRFIAGDRSAQPPPGPARDYPLLFVYGLASWVYRLVIGWAVALWIADHSRWLACAVLAFSLWMTIGRPIKAILRHSWQARWKSRRPVRELSGVALGIGLPVLLLTLVPVPDTTVLPGVVVPAEASKVRAPEAGHVAEVLAVAGQVVEPGTPLLRLHSDQLASEHARLRARLAGFEAERIRGLDRNLTDTRIAADEIVRARTELRALERRIERLLVRSESPGTIAFLDADGPELRQARQGEILMHVVDPATLRVQALARDDQVRRLGARLTDPQAPVQASIADHPGERFVMRLGVDTPESTRLLPAASLGERAGGPIPTDPADPDGLQALDSWFQLEFLPQRPLPRIGSLATVRIAHAPRPAAEQLLDTVRRVFVRRLEG
jgi:putative peptide zinc metalloprotease protein